MTQWEGFFTEGAGMEMKTLNQELAREAVGLMICVVCFLGFTLTAILEKRKHPTKLY